ncbi:MAG TPA: xanthine dehydrogenase family protein molybdopterin-binding subunit [Candidatus Dormibacteraeota bacterium]|jgi:carbon-monoxide dehydrogenase large subunit
MLFPTHRYVGERVQRIEDPRLLAGRGSFVDDIDLPRMAHAAFLRSPYPHARIASINCERAVALEGVLLVATGKEMNTLVTPFIAEGAHRELKSVTRPALPVDKARFVGEPIAVVVARSRYVAEDACELIEVEWEQLSAVSSVEAALSPAAPVLDEGVGSNVVAHIEYQNGDVESIFAGAHRIYSKRFQAQRATAAPLEARGVVTRWDSAAESLSVWMSTQSPFTVRSAFAKHLGLSESKVRLVAGDVGGGFGAKGGLSPEEAVVAAASRLVDRPVKWIEDRYENMVAGNHAKELTIDIELAVDAGGGFLALRASYTGDAGAYSLYPYTSLIDPMTAATLLPSLYRVPAAAYRVDSVLTNKCPAGPYRGVGRSSTLLALESLIDDAARDLGMDPIELRLKNIIPDKEPYTSATGMDYDGGSYQESLRMAAAAVGYERLREQQAELRQQGRYLGVGFCPYVEPCAWGSAMALANGFDREFFDSSSVTIEPDGSVTVCTGLFSHGQGQLTTLAQLTADQFGLPLDKVQVVQGDTSTAVYGMGSFASRSAVIGGGSITLAARDVRQKLLKIAGRAFEADVEDLELDDGKIWVKGTPAVYKTIAAIAELAYFGGASRPQDMEPALTSTRTYDPPETYSNGTIAVVVEVDIETGVIDVKQIIAVEDCGTAINPLIVDGQVIGGVAQGLGLAIYENLIYGADGQLLTSSFMDYLLPTSAEVCDVRVEHLSTPSPRTIGGIKGAGEAGTQATPAAVVNAVADALSPFRVIVGRTPLDPAELLRLIRARQDASSPG